MLETIFILQDFYTSLLYVTRLRTYKIARPRQKPRRGGGFEQINSCRKVLFQVTFKTKRFCTAFYVSYPSTDLSKLEVDREHVHETVDHGWIGSGPLVAPEDGMGRPAGEQVEDLQAGAVGGPAQGSGHQEKDEDR
jgi:hypothetical protein